MKIENNLYKILKEENKVNDLDDLYNLDEDEVEFLNSWKGIKDKVYFCYLGMGGVDCWKVDKSLNEFMYGMYGRVEDVKMLKRDILNEYGIKIGVDEENEVVYVWGEGDDE